MRRWIEERSFGDLVELNEPHVNELMRRWGLYFRRRSLASDDPEAD